MKNIGIAVWLLNLAFFLTPLSCFSQVLSDVELGKGRGLSSDKLILSDSSSITMQGSKPLFSFILNSRQHNSGETEAIKANDIYNQTFENNLTSTFKISDNYSSGWRRKITFENKGNDTVTINNVVPFGEDTGSVYITGKGPSDLARAWLFRSIEPKYFSWFHPALTEALQSASDA